MKILLCGGGTSGHIYPGLAIAQALRKKDEQTSFLFIGREGGFENRAVEKEGIPLKTIKVEGISRSLSVKNIKRIILALNAKKEAERIISEFKPNAVVGTGGYVTWPIIKAAQKMNIPTLIHESNVYPGLVTRLLSDKCDCVLLNYEETAKHLRAGTKTQVIGNPLRTDFFKITRNKARLSLNLTDKDIFILSFGGSGGSKRLNDVITSLMKQNLANTPNVSHLHATGNKYFSEYKNVDLSNSNGRCKIVPFIDDIPRMMKAADIVIARSGAVTLSEISMAGVCSILIPSPNVTNNHQYKNAKLLADASACVMIDEKELTEDLLRSKLEVLLKDRELRIDIAKKVKKFSRKDSAEIAAQEIMNLCSKQHSATK